MQDTNREWADGVDPLGEALHLLRMSGVFYCRSEFSAPWALALPPMQDCLMFHVATAGRCRLEVGDEAPRLLEPGDLALVPHGRGHRLRSVVLATDGQDAPTRQEREAEPAALFDLPRESLSERYEVLRHGGGGTPTSMVCGAVRFDHPAARLLVTMLPPLLCIRATDSAYPEWMHGTLHFMAAEARQMRPGGEAVLTRLADVLVIQALRSWIEQDQAARGGWLGALRDRQIGRALAQVHRDPARPWNLETLAAEAAMSRSAFAARFTALVGVPAMQYVARWRMHLALSHLQEHDDSIGALALRLGYQSEAAFSRAFKRCIGVSPGSLQRPARR
ncbi:AraC family transcriptional regulator [Aquabacterium sp. A7-Y]|uniref:AraC family transcriptional regulator n=1 Tax=Aquabacterium sp. A7-Y TaxID=1349605 RepID=UPI00223D87C6|nr:AraC family transcriptional regulator [Aquabacterium sp. A7-Y]MCW7538071.1 AraC family transcriptional regulator [Aquabacterium sp. A7-Y]